MTIRKGSNIIAGTSRGDLNLKANNDEVVHLTGNETISGNKTFSGNMTLTAQSGSPSSGLLISNDYTNYAISLQNTTITKGTAPSANTFCGIDFYSTVATNYTNRLGLLEFQYAPSKQTSASLCTYKANASFDTTSAHISIYYPASGNPYTYAPIPTDTYSATSGTQIATTGWTASNFVNLAGAQTISGEKTFLTTQWANPDGTTTTSAAAKKFSDGNFYIFMKNSSGDWLNGLQLSPSGSIYIGAWNSTQMVAPFGDNTHNLGDSERRWKQLYAGTTTIATSDERVKQKIEPLPDDVLDAWGEVDFYRYKFNDAVKEKGSEKARYHTGLIAQRIKEKFEAHNIDPFAYGLLCYDEWDAAEEEKDDEGNIVVKAQEAGNRYSLRYEECLCMEAAYQRRRADRIEERLKTLEEKLK